MGKDPGCWAHGVLPGERCQRCEALKKLGLEQKQEKFEALRAEYIVARKKRDDAESRLKARYGFDPHWRSWITKTERARLAQLDRAEDRVSEKIVELVAEVSPRDWKNGVPAWWVYEKLAWEDVVRPLGEPLSVVPPLSYGSTSPKT